MIWLMILALVVVLLVAAAVLPRHRRADPGFPVRFPWFWVVFPATCFAIAGTIGVLTVPSGGEYGWTMYPPSVQFLSNEQFNRIMWRSRALWVLPVVSMIGVGLSIWSWRRWSSSTFA